MTTPTNSHKAWTDKGGHVTASSRHFPAFFFDRTFYRLD